MSRCCGPVIYFPPCPTPVCPDVNPVGLSNGNLNGIGVMDSFVVQTGVFRGVVGDGTYVTTTLDAGNRSIIVALNAGAIPAAIPQATESVAGKGEVATQAETNAGALDTVFVTPLKLATRAATTTLTGLIRIGTVPEASAFTSNAVAITPLTLGLMLDAVKDTKVFANAAARAAALPDFQGQVGVQIDTDQMFTANGVAPGDWQTSYLQGDVTNTLGGTTLFSTVAAGEFHFLVDSNLCLSITLGEVKINADTTLDLLTGSILNFATTAVVKVNSVTVPANSLIGTSGTLGQVSSFPKSNFLSSYNTEATWAQPTGALLRADYDPTTVTLPNLAKTVAALITDLIAIKLPATP